MASLRETLPSARAIGGATAIVQTQSITWWQCNTTTLQGFYVISRQVPDQMDVTRPATLAVFLRNTVANVTSGLFLLLQVFIERTRPGFPATTIIFTQQIAVPNPWSNQDNLFVSLSPDPPNAAPPIPGGTFDPADLIGFALARLPTDPLDTYPNAILMATALELTYARRCQFFSCC